MATVTAPFPRSATTSLRRNPAAAWRHLDVVLVGCVASISAIGALMVYSATRGPGQGEPYDTTFLKRQLGFVALGGLAMLLTAVVDYRHVRDWAVVVYVGTVALLLLVVSPLGSASKGTQAWFQIGSFQLQPSEIAKVGLVVGLAALLNHYREEVDLRRLVVALAVAGVPLALILLQPDLGTSLVLVAITVVMLLVGGARGKHLLALILLGAIGSGIILTSDLLQDYQKARLTVFLDQEQELQGEAYNLNQSVTAISSGGMLGKGLFRGTQTRLQYVPEQHTDFIFTAVGEELGFVGAATLIALFAIVVWRMWRTAQFARDAFGTLVCAGALALFLFQVFQNVGMTMGIMPITGIPLPFVSYGGSSTIAQFVAIGLVLNVHMRRFA